MIHFGDITKISGLAVPPVDVITGGSPCQDLSVAGKRAGLDGERSGLFMEQIRIIKEMRSRYVQVGGSDQLVRLPRYCVWENVPGAFSSNGGKDFQAVLTEFVRIAEPDAPDVPLPEKGRWPKSGCIYDGLGRWSLAWRVHDAQFWGVPQRRKRIALVADLGGLSAPEILFERKGLSGDPEPCGAAREETAGATGGGVDSAIGFTNRGYGSGSVAETLRSDPHGAYPMVTQSASVGVDVCDARYVDTTHADDVVRMDDTAAPLQARDHKGGKLVYDARGNGDGEIAPTMTGDHQNRVTDYTALCVGNGQLNQMSMAEQANTLDTMHDQQAVMVAAVDCRNGVENPDTNGTLQSKPNGGMSLNYQNVCRTGSIVRRLTPLECERLQGFPDGWTDIGEWTDSKGKKHKDADSPRYKALGNSIALPFWQFLARRICAQYERNITMASLFDGIGGFPLVFERCGAKAVWASEIEEFPIAVTKKHFPEEG